MLFSYHTDQYSTLLNFNAGKYLREISKYSFFGPVISWEKMYIVKIWLDARPPSLS